MALHSLSRIQEELADVVIYALLIAHDLGINLADTVDAKLTANAERYDVDTYRGSAEKAPH